MGRGETSVVWRAHDELLDEAVALKFVAEIVAQDAVAVDDLRQKTARARWLAHSHIIRVNDFMRDNTLATVSMEYVEAATLEQKRLEQPGHVFSPAALAPLILQICQALDYAHESARIVHRGLKPSNVLVTPEGQVKITDFGIACSLAEARFRLTGRNERDRATRFRLSPQQLEGIQPSPADDIYAFGAMLYELLAGQPPFPAGELGGHLPADAPVAIAVRRTESGLMGEPISPAWEKAVAACLARDPMRRPSSGNEIVGLLELAGPAPAKAEPLQMPDTARAKEPAPLSERTPPAAPTRGSANPLIAWAIPVSLTRSSASPLSARTPSGPPSRSSASPLFPKKRSLIHFLTRDEPEQKKPEEQIVPIIVPLPVEASAPEPAAAPVPASEPVIEQAAALEAPKVVSTPPIPPVVPAPLEKVAPVEEPAPDKEIVPEAAAAPVPASVPVIVEAVAVEAPRVASAPPIPVVEPAPAEKVAPVEEPAPDKEIVPEAAVAPVPASVPVIVEAVAVEAPRVASTPPIPVVEPAPL